MICMLVWSNLAARKHLSHARCKYDNVPYSRTYAWRSDLEIIGKQHEWKKAIIGELKRLDAIKNDKRTLEEGQSVLTVKR